jgi:hypothetical protein
MDVVMSGDRKERVIDNLYDILYFLIAIDAGRDIQNKLKSAILFLEQTH